MAQERIELRFSPVNADERALIDALESQGEQYGARGRFLKSRLVRGYYALVREVERIEQESDPLAALDRLAQSVNAGHYRVLRALLHARRALVAVPVPHAGPDWSAFRALAGSRGE